MRLELGRKYKDRKGREFGPLQLSGPDFYTDQDRRGFLWYRNTGINFCCGIRPDWDLVELAESHP